MNTGFPIRSPAMVTIGSLARIEDRFENDAITPATRVRFKG
ncbi:MAG: hypothetical protein ACI9QL_002497 [Candidatus Omnitrophota bacterium]|jgi:hypothetical protein